MHTTSPRRRRPARSPSARGRSRSRPPRPSRPRRAARGGEQAPRLRLGQPALDVAGVRPRVVEGHDARGRAAAPAAGGEPERQDRRRGHALHAEHDRREVDDALVARGEQEGLGDRHHAEHPQEARLAQRDHVLDGEVGDGQQRHGGAEEQQRVGGVGEARPEGQAQQQLGRHGEDEQRRRGDDARGCRARAAAPAADRGRPPRAGSPRAAGAARRRSPPTPPPWPPPPPPRRSRPRRRRAGAWPGSRRRSAARRAGRGR